MTTPRVALELYSVRTELERDPLGTLEAVAAMGYDGVEFAGPPKFSGSEIREWLAKTGLVCCGWHTPFNLVQKDTLAATIELNRMIGNRNIIVPGMPAKTREDWLDRAAFFNELAAELAPLGMFTGYHNHHLEFQPLESGETPWDLFFGNTAPEVIMQLDLGNALRGGADLMAILRRYPGRCRTIHIKPYSKSAGADDPAAGYRPMIGEDDVPWSEVFAFCETRGNTEWYIVEYESDAYPRLEAVERCRRALEAMGK
jgi:sugar phosphate isomerase/epimerase